MVPGQTRGAGADCRKDRKPGGVGLRGRRFSLRRNRLMPNGWLSSRGSQQGPKPHSWANSRRGNLVLLTRRFFISLFAPSASRAARLQDSRPQRPRTTYFLPTYLTYRYTKIRPGAPYTAVTQIRTNRAVCGTPLFILFYSFLPITCLCPCVWHKHHSFSGPSWIVAIGRRNTKNKKLAGGNQIIRGRP